MKVVLINGEAQVGKSVYANHLANLLLEQGITAETYSFVEIYQGLLAHMFKFIHGDAADGMTYEDMKKSTLVPGLDFDGRNWMIQIGNASRGLHPYMLPAIFYAHAKLRPEVDVWIIENWGFPNEYEFFQDTSRSADVIEVYTIHLNARATRKYAPGEQFDGDNRVNLEVMASNINPPVNYMAGLIDPLHDYPIDTIAAEFNPPAPELPEGVSESVTIETPADTEAVVEPEL